MAIRRFSCLLLLVFCSCCAHTKLNGSYMMNSPNSGETSFLPTVCYSGDRQYFFGVDLKTKSDPLYVRVFQDPVQGTFLKVVSDDAGTPAEILFDKSSCSVLKGELQQTRWLVNEIRDISGELEVDCRNGNGNSIKGKVTFIHCH